MQIINSVLLDHVIIADNCHCQNTTVGAGCLLRESCMLKDSTVGPGMDLKMGTDLRGETASKAKV
jgi:hypothetical protein